MEEQFKKISTPNSTLFVALSADANTLTRIDAIRTPQTDPQRPQMLVEKQQTLCVSKPCSTSYRTKDLTSNVCGAQYLFYYS